MQRKVKTIALQLGICALFLAVLLMPLAGQVLATDRYWIGGNEEHGYQMWYLENNWNTQPDGSGGSGVPNTGDIVYITNANSEAALNVTTPSLEEIQIDNDSTLTWVGYGHLTAYKTLVGITGVGTINMGWGSHTVNQDLILGNEEGAHGIYNLEGGSLDVTGIWFYEGTKVGNRGTGEFNQYGGTHTVNGNLSLGYDTSGYGYYYLGVGDGLLEVKSYDDYTGYSVVGYDGRGYFVQDGGQHIARGLMVGGGPYATSTTSEGRYELWGGSIDVEVENIGINGKGYFTQHGGKNTISDWLTIGTYTGNEGYYTLNLGELKATNGITVGDSGFGVFDQWGGSVETNNLYIGRGYSSYPDLGGEGIYNLIGGTLNVNSAEIIGGWGEGVGTFNQTGGTHTVKVGTGENDYFIIGNWWGTKGTYNLSGSTSVLSVIGNEYVGCAGEGTFNQEGGQHTITGDLIIGEILVPGVKGEYNLSNGTLTANGNTFVGWYGTGVFNQSGGAHTTNGLVLGQFEDSSGTYNLSGDGYLSISGDIYLGVDGTGLFTQYDNSSVAANNLFIGSSTGSGTYELYGGKLTLAGVTNVGYASTGTFIQDGGTHTVAGDFGAGVGSTGNGYYELNGGMLSVGGAERIGVDGTGSFKQTGGTHKIGIDLVLANNTGSTGNYNLQGGELKVGFDLAGNPTDGYTFVGMNGLGTFNQYGGTHTISGGLTLGQENGSEGFYFLNTGTSGEPNNGSLSVGDHEHIGLAGKGTFTQGAGTHTIGGDLVLGNDKTGEGTFNLSGGTVSVASSVYVGWDGLGLFNQSGGDVTTRELFLGSGTSGNGTYIMGGTSSLVIGDSGSMNGWFDVASTGKASFQQDSGSVTVNGAMFVGSGSGGVGIYELKGGALEVKGDEVKIGGEGTGTIIQTGGEFKFAGAMYLGDQPTGKGTYYMQGGKLSSGGLALGEWGGRGEFYQSAGEVTVNSLQLARQAGSNGYYELSGSGVLNTGDVDVGVNGNGHFAQSGGTHTATGTITIGSITGIGAYEFLSGSLSANNIMVNNGSLFKGIGTINGYDGPVNFVNKGTVAPGTSPGTLTINGNYIQDALGILEIELGGLGNHDILNITGIADLAGTLKLLLYGDYTASEVKVGDFFDVLFASAITGEFTVNGSATGWNWNIAYLDFDTSVIGPDTVRLTAQAPVPIPPTVWLLGAGLIGLFGIKRKFKR